MPGSAADGIALLDRPTTPLRVAEVLRERILLGQLPSGTRCAEQQLSAALGVSRNTLREAFQVLVGERLLVHEPHRGVFVRRLGVADVRDIYTFRRVVECGALAHPVRLGALDDMRAAVTAGQAAAATGDWVQVGTEDVRFHVAVTAAAGSPRLDRVVRALFVELRLAFQLVPEPAALHGPFLARNAGIVELALAGEHGRASAALRDYLDDAEDWIVAAVGAG